MSASAVETLVLNHKDRERFVIVPAHSGRTCSVSCCQSADSSIWICRLFLWIVRVEFLQARGSVSFNTGSKDRLLPFAHLQYSYYLNYWTYSLIMVARSSVARAGKLLLFCGEFLYLFPLLSPQFLRCRKTDVPETFPHDVASPTEPLLYRFLRSAP